jgi:phospholipid/cholesterol/gamma-HCH transport system substrate-binding protein
MISRFTQRQLFAFALVTALSVGLMGAYYVRIPQLLGLGRYELTVDLPATGGLYPKSIVTYRGHDVGVVQRIELGAAGGVRAVLSVDNDTSIPMSSKVQVRSASAIGEQYLNFEPSGTSSAAWSDGDHVTAGADAIPVSTGELLTSVNSFFASVPRDSLTTTIEELGKAFAGSGDDLGRLLDSGTSFQETADANLAQTLELIRSLDPVLATQQDLDPVIRSYAGDLDLFTATLAASDADLRSILETGPPLAQEVIALTRDLNQSLPMLLTDLSLAGEVAKVYIPGIEHTLAVLPAAIEMHFSSLPESRKDDAYPEANLSFKASVNNPPTCGVGFADRDKQRSPKDLSPAPAPQDSYCKVAPDDPRVVRGARNQACPTGGYGATAADCGLIFQPDGADLAERVLAGGGDGAYDPTTGRFLAPDGTFYLIDDLDGASVATSWQELMREQVRS